MIKLNSDKTILRFNDGTIPYSSDSRNLKNRYNEKSIRKIDTMKNQYNVKVIPTIKTHTVMMIL